MHWIAEISRLSSELGAALLTAEERRTLIVKLENDLLHVRGHSSSGLADVFDPTGTPQDPIAKIVDDAVPLFEHDRSPPLPASDTSFVGIITSQRDRLRARVDELEEHDVQQQQHLAMLSTEIDKVRADNVKLYEKIKFLQSYAGNKGSYHTDDTEERYSQQYEQSLDPFHKFNQLERQRKYMSLRVHDKATLGIGRLIMSSGSGRAFFFFYLLFLHCLVFLVLYKLAHTESCKRDFAQDCLQKYAEHMQVVHNEQLHHGT